MNQANRNQQPLTLFSTSLSAFHLLFRGCSNECIRLATPATPKARSPCCVPPPACVACAGKVLQEGRGVRSSGGGKTLARSGAGCGGFGGTRRSRSLPRGAYMLVSFVFLPCRTAVAHGRLPVLRARILLETCDPGYRRREVYLRGVAIVSGREQKQGRSNSSKGTTTKCLRFRASL